MSDSSGFDFTKFVPGFDFLKTMTSGHSAAPTVGAGWIAPSLDPQELDKRIQELKTVHFWLDQNTKAVSATIQALEVQRMTLATLQGMNLSFAELAESLKVAPTPADESPAAADEAVSQATAQTPEQTPEPTEPPAAKKKRSTKASESAASQAVDPAQWWGALTQQFQQIANNAMQEMAKSADQQAAQPPSEPAPAAAAPVTATKKTTRRPAAKRRTSPSKKS